jgi:hypothetical protein
VELITAIVGLRRKGGLSTEYALASIYWFNCNMQKKPRMAEDLELSVLYIYLEKL